MKNGIFTLSIIVAAVMVQAAPLTFKTSDGNADGAVSKEEWMEAQKAANPKANSANHANWFKNWDKDSDGRISQTEFTARKKQQAAENAKRKGQGQTNGKRKAKGKTQAKGKGKN